MLSICSFPFCTFFFSMDRFDFESNHPWVYRVIMLVIISNWSNDCSVTYTLCVPVCVACGVWRWEHQGRGGWPCEAAETHAGSLRAAVQKRKCAVCHGARNLHHFLHKLDVFFHARGWPIFDLIDHTGRQLARESPISMHGHNKDVVSIWCQHLSQGFIVLAVGC